MNLEQSKDIFGPPKDQKKIDSFEEKEQNWNKVINLFSMVSGINLKQNTKLNIIKENIEKSSEKNKEIYEFELVKEMLKILT